MQQAGELTRVPEGGTNTYKYTWKFGGTDLANLENVMLFSGHSKLETNVINFDSGILKDVEHAMQLFISLNDGPQLFAKIFMKEPAMKKYFTHSKIEVIAMCASLESSWRIFSKINKSTLPPCLCTLDTPDESYVTWWKSRKIAFTKGIGEITFKLNVKYAYWCASGIETIPCLVAPQKSNRRKTSESSEKEMYTAKSQESLVSEQSLVGSYQDNNMPCLRGSITKFSPKSLRVSKGKKKTEITNSTPAKVVNSCSTSPTSSLFEKSMHMN